MTIHDPLLAQQYGGQEAYEDLVATDAFMLPPAFNNMTRADKARQVYNVVCAALFANVSMRLPEGPPIWPTTAAVTIFVGASALYLSGNIQRTEQYRQSLSSVEL